MEDDKDEIEDWIEENKLAKALLKKSGLKKGELKSMILYFQDEESSFQDIASKLGINRSGAWKRYKKGYEKIIESFFTLELAVYSGILEPGAVQHFVKDLEDYLNLAHQQGDKEMIRTRLEKRMAELEKKK